MIGPNSAAAAEQPTAVYGGDTITINAFKDASSAATPAAKPVSNPPSASDDEYERQPDDEEESVEAQVSADDELLSSDDESVVDEQEDDEDEEAPAEEFIDESNPFYAAKKAMKDAEKQTTGAKKPAFQDTSDAANDILRRLMEKRRANRG